MFVQDWGMEDALATIRLERNAFSNAYVKLGPLEPGHPLNPATLPLAGRTVDLSRRQPVT